MTEAKFEIGDSVILQLFGRDDLSHGIVIQKGFNMEWFYHIIVGTERFVRREDILVAYNSTHQMPGLIKRMVAL